MAEFGNNFDFGESPFYKDDGEFSQEIDVLDINDKGDIYLYLNHLKGYGDIILNRNGNDLQRDAGFETSIFISLFTDKRAAPSDILPANITDYRGWWSDNKLGSRLWLLERETNNKELIARAEEYCQEALQWMTKDDIASKINIVVTLQKNDPTLLIEITILQKTKGQQSFKFYYNWKEQVVIGV
jgi:phage gp46-like protein